MGLFDKKYCDVCGEKIGLLGNRKLEDGNLCKDCAKKLSPFFNERRHSTVDDIKRQLAYREENRSRLASFSPSLTFGSKNKIHIDTAAGKFIVTNRSDWNVSNPDLIGFEQVRNIDTDVRENKRELYYRDEQGNQRSYNPRRYECNYEFNVTITVNSPWFDVIKVELSEGNRPDSPYTDLYRDYDRQMYRLSDLFLNRMGTVSANDDSFAKSQPTQPAAQAVNGGSWVCAACGAVNSGNFCVSCGSGKVPARSVSCKKCGFTPSDPSNPPKFCPECGQPF